MLNLLSSRTVYAIGVALAATILSAASLHAGLFNIPSEPADWNGPFVAFNSGVVLNNLHNGDYFVYEDITKQYNTEFMAANAPPDWYDGFDYAGHGSTETAYIGGVDLGYNKQWGHFVGGFGFGFSGTHTSTWSQGFGFDENYDDYDGDYYYTEIHSIRKIEQNWSGYAGAQAGFAFNRWFFYAMGGAAFAQVDLKTFDVSNTEFEGGTFTVQSKSVNDINNVLTGWYAGGGVQFALSNVLTAGLEFRHNDYGDRLYHPEARSGGALFPSAIRVGLDNNEILFKVGILLGHLGEKPKP